MNVKYKERLLRILLSDRSDLEEHYRNKSAIIGKSRGLTNAHKLNLFDLLGKLIHNASNRTQDMKERSYRYHRNK